jgi:hypothetical protein
MDILLVKEKRISPQQLKAVCDGWFEDMVKVVVDIEKGVICAGGELHADAEKKLIAEGSKQSSIWGANFYPWHPQEERIEYTALINIRPGQDNPAMNILNPQIQTHMRKLIETLLLPADEELV